MVFILSSHQGGVDTFQPGQGVVAALLRAGEEAVAVQEVGPGHLDGLEGVAALPPQLLARAAAGLGGAVAPATGSQHGAAHQPDVRGALSVQQAVEHRQQEVLGPRLGVQLGAVAQDVGVDGPVGGREGGIATSLAKEMT